MEKAVQDYKSSRKGEAFGQETLGKAERIKEVFQFQFAGLRTQLCFYCGFKILFQIHFKDRERIFCVLFHSPR